MHHGLFQPMRHVGIGLYKRADLGYATCASGEPAGVTPLYWQWHLTVVQSTVLSPANFLVAVAQVETP